MEKATMDFLKSLKKNNNRDWFNEHKQAYESAVSDFAVLVQELISGVRKIDKSVPALKPKDCVFRIFRDVRFSRNKAPYKSNFGAFIASGGRKGGRAGYYFHLEPGESFVGGGLYMPDGKALARVRNALERDHVLLRKILASKPFQKSYGALLREDVVKTVPRGFSKDHPALEYLQLKSYVAIRKMEDSVILSDKLVRDILLHFDAIAPLNAFFNQRLTAG